MIKYYCDTCQRDHTHEELCPMVKIAVNGMVKQDRDTNKLTAGKDFAWRLRQVNQD